jgi:hypothetical protein
MIMNEEPKSFWWKCWGRPARFFLWLMVLSLVVATGARVIAERIRQQPGANDFAAMATAYGFCASFVVSTIGLILSALPRTRWLMTWAIRRWFFCVATLVTLGALFYAEEDWRGKRAWEKNKHDLEASGVVLNWDQFFPPPVPDDQNIFKAPKMQEWFAIAGGKRSASNELDGMLRSPTNFPVWGSSKTIQTETDARAYLAWSDQLQPQFNLIRDALKRPYARMDGDYTQVLVIPIPHFIAIRGVGRTLVQRSHCYLILHQPDKAVSELALVHDLRHLLEAAPDGKPMTLVAAMINVAVAGLYVDAIGDGFRQHAWRDEELVDLEKQLSEINVIIPVNADFQAEHAATTHAFETVPISQILSSFRSDQQLLRIAPRGWVYQNMAHQSPFFYARAKGLDPVRESVSPSAFKETQARADEFLSHKSPFNILARLAMPNFLKAIQTTARNQNQVNEARVACALERYKLAHSQYPDSLDALVPQFIEKIPHDVINNGQLKYLRSNDGFVLYSIGWDEKDDGGSTVMMKDGRTDPASSDWVWEYSAK